MEGFDVIGEAADGASALARARELRPAIALVDIHLPDIDGLALAAQLAALVEPPAVVLISGHDVDGLERLLAHSGARGFIPKDELSRDAIERLVP